ncbi:Nitrogen permease reactivator protein, partial [Biomphalaria glabrata]
MIVTLTLLNIFVISQNQSNPYTVHIIVMESTGVLFNGTSYRVNFLKPLLELAVEDHQAIFGDFINISYKLVETVPGPSQIGALAASVYYTDKVNVFFGPGEEVLSSCVCLSPHTSLSSRVSLESQDRINNISNVRISAEDALITTSERAVDIGVAINAARKSIDNQKKACTTELALVKYRATNSRVSNEGVITLSYMALQWNLPVITPRGNDPVSRNNSIFPNIICMHPYDKYDMFKVTMQICQKYDWKHLSLFTDFNKEVMKTTGDVFKNYASAQVEMVTYDLFNLNKNDDELLKKLIESSSNSRVYVLLMSLPDVRRCLLLAARLGMTSREYLYIVPDIEGSVSTNRSPWQFNDTDDMVRLA